MDTLTHFLERLWDHWYWLLGLLLMIEPLADYWLEGFRGWANKYMARRTRSLVAITISVLSLLIASFLAFGDEYKARQIDELKINGTASQPGYIQQLQKANDLAKSQSDRVSGFGGYDDQIAQLRGLLGKTGADLTFLQRNKPQVVVQTKEVPVVIPSGAIQMTQEQKDRVKVIRIGLADFLAEGEGISNELTDDNVAKEEARANEWLGRLQTYLKNNLDESYVTRLNNNSDAPSTIRTGIQQRTQNLWQGLRFRLVRINQFIAELSR